jgi:hypothetical protein
VIIRAMSREWPYVSWRRLEAVVAVGRRVLLAGPGCPPGLRELARVHSDDRWIVILSPEIRPGGERWIRATADDPASPGRPAATT